MKLILKYSKWEIIYNIQYYDWKPDHTDLLNISGSETKISAFQWILTLKKKKKKFKKLCAIFLIPYVKLLHVLCLRIARVYYYSSLQYITFNILV